MITKFLTVKKGGVNIVTNSKIYSEMYKDTSGTNGPYTKVVAENGASQSTFSVVVDRIPFSQNSEQKLCSKGDLVYIKKSGETEYTYEYNITEVTKQDINTGTTRMYITVDRAMEHVLLEGEEVRLVIKGNGITDIIKIDIDGKRYHGGAVRITREGNNVGSAKISAITYFTTNCGEVVPCSGLESSNLAFVEDAFYYYFIMPVFTEVFKTYVSFGSASGTFTLPV